MKHKQFREKSHPSVRFCVGTGTYLGSGLRPLAVGRCGFDPSYEVLIKYTSWILNARNESAFRKVKSISGVQFVFATLRLQHLSSSLTKLHITIGPSPECFARLGKFILRFHNRFGLVPISQAQNKGVYFSVYHFVGCFGITLKGFGVLSTGFIDPIKNLHGIIDGCVCLPTNVFFYDHSNLLDNKIMFVFWIDLFRIRIETDFEFMFT